MSTGVIYDVIVVGAGIEGSATAYQLAKRGKHVLLLEQFPLPHSRGSSHGQSRITRKAYGDKDFYTLMMDEAYALTDELQAETGQQLFENCGCLLFGPKNNGYIKGTLSAMMRHNLPHEMFDVSEGRRRYPEFSVPEDTVFILDHSGGILKADKCLMAFQSQFVKYGGTIRDEEPMVNLIPDSTVTINTNKQSYRAKSVVLALGAWAAKFLPKLGVNIPLQPLRTTVCYWREKSPGQFSVGKMPTFINVGCERVYGLPSYEYPGLVKVCLHTGPATDPDCRDKAEQEQQIKIIKGWVEKHVDVLETGPSIVEPCIYTMTPDEDFILDHHPAWDNIVIGAGFSGHGFKLSPVVGGILADLATGQRSKYDLTPFKINRFLKHRL